MWSSIIFDKQLKVVEVVNCNPRLFFGVQILGGMRLNEVVGNGVDMPQTERVVSAIECAFAEQRTVCLTYLSQSDRGVEVCVTAYAEWRDNGMVCLNAMEIDSADVNRMKAVDQSPIVRIADVMLHEMSICLELYDSQAKLVEISDAALQLYGVLDKSEVLGLCLFDNPNMSDAVREKLCAGESVHFRVEYNLALANEYYYRTTSAATTHLDVTIAVIKDAAGNIVQYLLEVKDMTDFVLLKKRHEVLYNQNRIVVDAMPVGMVLYSGDGNMIHVNDMLGQMFGVDKNQFNDLTVSIFDDPSLPIDIKDAVREGVNVDVCFKYDMKKVVEAGFYETTLTDKSIHLKCCGRPAFNSAGKVENYIFIIEDVTESVRTEEILRHNRQRTVLAMDAAGIVVWEFDVRTRMFTTENEPLNASQGELAMSMDDYMSLGDEMSSDSLGESTMSMEDYMTFIHPDDQAAITAEMAKAIMGENVSFNVDLRMLFPGNPETQYCTVLGIPFERDNDGRVVKYVGARKNNTMLQKKRLLQDNILNDMPLPIHIKDVDSGRYVFCNEESRSQFGTTDGGSVRDVVISEDAARIEKSDNDVISSGKPYYGEERIELKNGHIYDTIVRKSLIYDGGKRLLLTVRWDQSLQKDLQRRSKALSMSMDALDAYFWYYDAVTHTINYGDGVERLGIDPVDINTIEKFATRVHPDDRQNFLDVVFGALDYDNIDYIVEFRMDMDNCGNYQWWENRGVVETLVRNGVNYKYMFGMDINIDAHKHTELTLVKNKEALKKLVQQNELVLNNTNSGLAYISSDYIVQWENTAACPESKVLTFVRGELCYKKAHNLTQPCENCVMNRAIASRQMEMTKFTLNSGRVVEILAMPVFEDDGAVDGVVMRVDDVTDREIMIDELKKAKARAEQSDKLKSAFLANMSHEIRTPLNAIVGFSELMMETDAEEERKEYAQVINTNNELLLKLISDILDLSKIEAGSIELKYEDFDLSEYFDGMVLSMRQRVTNSNIELRAVNPYSVCQVRLDRNRVAQIMSNYVTNAIKYTPRGFIDMSYECTSEGIRFYVKDSGIGIADDKKSKVFQRFEKLDEFAQGTGLGLSICKAITDSMGGEVGFESTYGEGSLFWVFLPCSTSFTCL